MNDDVVSNQGDSLPPSGPTAGENQGDGVGGRAEKRIRQLLEENRILRKTNQNLSQGAERLDSIESRLGGGTEEPKRSPRSWDEVSDSDLSHVLSSGPQQAPEQFQAALDEVIRRRARSHVDSLKDEILGNVRHESTVERVNAQIASEFGQDASEGTELFNEANRLYAERIARFERSFPGKGREMVNRDPELQLECYRLAKANLTRIDPDEHARIVAERDRLMRGNTGPRGNVNAIPPSSKRKEAMDRGDVKAAIRALHTVSGVPPQE